MVSLRSTSLLLGALIGVSSGLAHGQTSPRPTAATPAVVFVCEHGAAKSVIATAYFNKLAAERGLPYRATFRGTTPQEALSVRAVAGLKEDGVAIPPGAPAAIGVWNEAAWDAAQMADAFTQIDPIFSVICVGEGGIRNYNGLKLWPIFKNRPK